jgi:hypothetical protein
VADAPPLELPPAVRHEVLGLLELSVRDEQVIWRTAGWDEEHLRAGLVAQTGIAAVLVAALAARRKVREVEIVDWLRRRL